MFRSSLMWWLVGCVLACPFQCMSGYALAAACSSAPVSEATCDCCHHDDAPSDSPDLPFDNGGCCDCICEGAILASDDSVGAAGPGEYLHGIDLDSDLAGGSPVAGLSSLWETVASTVRPARAVRLAMHSLQV